MSTPENKKLPLKKEELNPLSKEYINYLDKISENIENVWQAIQECEKLGLRLKSFEWDISNMLGSDSFP